MLILIDEIVSAADLGVGWSKESDGSDLAFAKAAEKSKIRNDQIDSKFGWQKYCNSTRSMLSTSKRQ